MADKKKTRGRPRLNPGARKDELLQVRMPPDLLAALKLATQAEGVAISELVRTLLKEWLDERA